MLTHLPQIEQLNISWSNKNTVVLMSAILPLHRQQMPSRWTCHHRSGGSFCILLFASFRLSEVRSLISCVERGPRSHEDHEILTDMKKDCGEILYSPKTSQKETGCSVVSGEPMQELIGGITIPTLEQSKEKELCPSMFHHIALSQPLSIIFKTTMEQACCHTPAPGRRLDVGRILLVTVLAGVWDAGQFGGPLHKFVHGLPQIRDQSGLAENALKAGEIPVGFSGRNMMIRELEFGYPRIVVFSFILLVFVLGWEHGDNPLDFGSFNSGRQVAVD